MACIYAYVCRNCGASTELDRLPAEGSVMRHLVEGKVCGTFRRDYTSINVNRVPGGRP